MAGPTRQQQLVKIAGELDAANPGKGLGAKFLAFASSRPSWTIPQLESGFAAEIGLQGVGQGVTGGLGAGGKATGQAITGASSGAAKAAGQISSATGIFAIGHWLGDLVTWLTDVHMWIFLGWLMLGVLLLVFGLVWWNKGTIAKGAAMAAVL